MSKRILIKVARPLNRFFGKFGFVIKHTDSGYRSVRKKPYSHMRILSFNESGYFSSIADYTQIDTVNIDEYLDVGCDMLIYEPELASRPIDKRVIESHARHAKELAVPCVLLVSDDWQDSNEVAHHFDHIFVVGAKSPIKTATVLSNSVDAQIDNPIGLSYSERNRTALIPHSSNIEDRPLLGFTGKTEYMAIENNSVIFEPQKIDKEVVNKTWVGLVIRENFSADSEYVHWALRLMANGIRTVVDDISIMPEGLQNNVIPEVSAENLDSELEELFQTYDSWEKAGVLQTRTVLGSCERVNSFEELLKHLSIAINPKPILSVLAVTKRPEYLERMLANIKKQINVKLEVKVGLHGISPSSIKSINLTKNFKNTHVTIDHYPKSEPLGAILRDLSQGSSGSFIAKMDDDDYYGANHLHDLLIAHRYADAAIVGKWSNFVWFEEEEKLINWRVDKQEKYVPHLPGATWLAKAELIKAYGFSNVKRSVDSTLLDRLRADGHKLYSTHRFNFVRSRHSDHTYKAEGDKFIKDSDGRVYNSLDEQIYTI